MALLIKMIHKRASIFILTISICVISILVSLWWNSKISSIINKITDKENIHKALIYSLILIIILSSVSAYILSILSGWTCESLSYDLRMGYANHINSLSIYEIEKMNSGEHLSKLQNEITEVSEYLCANLFPLVNDCIRFFATFIWMCCLNAKLTILAHIPVLLILCYIVVTSKILERYAHKTQEANENICKDIDLLITIFPILRIFQASKLINNNYNKSLKEWEELSIKEEQTRAKFMSFSALFSCIPLALLFVFGGSQVIHGKMTIGNLYIFINLSGNVSGSLMNMPGRISAFRRFSVNMSRLKESIQLEKMGD